MTDVESVPQFSTAEFEPDLPDSHGLFLRGLLFGAVGALIGMALYAAVVIITEYEIGFVSLAVGYIVGKAVLMGSRGRRGRRYQVAAALLTYFAVSMAFVPIVISQLATSGTSAESGPAIAGTPEVTPTATTETDLQPIGMGALLRELIIIGITSPFLALKDMPGGLISLFILAIGVQIAWKNTGRASTPVAQVLTASSDDDKPTSLDLGR